MTNNPYRDYINDKQREESKVKPKRQFPCKIGWRTFQTQEEYDQALHDFLNGY
jgi:hypothetical protein